MGRQLEGWLHVSGVLAFPRGVAVGGLGGDDVDVDLQLSRDAAGRLVVPGTSLAGTMRAWATAHGLDVTSLFGGADRQEGASALWVHDARFHEDAAVEVRDHVGIDRRTGGAANGLLYRREIVAPGEAARLVMNLELPLDPTLRQQRLQATADLLRALGDGLVSVGASTTRGLGLMRVEQIDVRIERLADLPDLLAGAELPSFELPTPNASKAASRFEVTWIAISPIMVKSGRDGIAIDGLPLVSRPRASTSVEVLLPGSAVKGRLRSLAEYICRTVTQLDAPADVLEQMSQLEPVERLFGARPRGQGAPGSRGALRVADVVLAEIPISLWDALSEAAKSGDDDSELRRAVRRLDEGGWGRVSDNRLDVATHVAIDRWTGAASGPRLFTAIEPFLPGPHEFHFQLDPDLLGHDRAGSAATFLWLLVLRELARGTVGFGHGTHRGQGFIRLPVGEASVRLIGPHRGALAVLGDRTNLGEVRAEDVAELLQAWQAFCAGVTVGSQEVSV